jgi:uncharacterized membrane protein YphA (DoxX/SURF4 family)
MGKYGKLSRQVPPPQRPWAVHPIWRGIGCLILVIGPFIAIAAAHLVLDMNLEQGWFPIPSEFISAYPVPGLGPVDHFFADLLLAGVFLLIGFAIMMIVYAIAYSILGPPRYGPLDSPPIRDKGKYLRR